MKVLMGVEKMESMPHDDELWPRAGAHAGILRGG